MSSPIRDDLQDLSPEDAQELRAFLDKRRWFEAKLKVLESLPPIYPFVHPGLAQPASSSATSSSLVVYADLEKREWRLPSETDVRRGQKERDALEEEILAFDGGDLMRMKEKTRAATLLPLTPPSTHLVSITLALIVVIDRLLTLLRHRGELLELTSMRLQWDSLRWQIMLETARVRAEVDEIARGKGRWVPPARVREDRRDSKSGVRTPTGSPLPRSSTLPATSSVSSSLSDLSTSSLTPSKAILGFSRSKQDSVPSLASLATSSTPKRSLHLPLLRSSIANLEIRQRNLASTSVSRSGKILDKMIDVAIPLKDLGGTEGPGADGEGGAVPDELLDIQDDIEGEVTELESRVSWCRALERQWDAADKHYLASTQAHEQAEAVLEALLGVIPSTTMEEKHRQLSERLSDIRKAFPPSIDDTFPKPSHRSYPEHAGHTETMLEQLQQGYAEAQQKLTACDQALEWAHRLAAADVSLSTSIAAAEASLAGIRATLSALDAGQGGTPRPKLDDLSSIHNDGTVERWLFSIPGHADTSRSIAEKSSAVNQRLAVAIVRYKQVARAPPKVIRERLGDGVRLDVADHADQLADDCQEELARLVTAAAEAQQDAEVLQAVQAAKTTTEQLRSRMTILRRDLDSAGIPSLETVVTLRAGMAELQAERPGFTAKVEKVQAVLRSQERSVSPLSEHIAGLSRGICREMDDLSEQVALVAAISEQSATVTAIEAEAADLVQQIQRVLDRTHTTRKGNFSRSGVSGENTKSLIDDTHALQSSIRTWTDGVADRVRFVATGASATTSDVTEDQVDLRSRPLLAATTSASAPPMTPPASPPIMPAVEEQRPASTATTRDPAQYDHRSRMRVNEATSRVNGRLAALNKEIDLMTSEREANASDVFGTIAAVPPVSTVTEASQVMTIASLQRRLSDLQLDMLLYPSTSIMQQTPTYRQIPSSPKAKRIRDELKAIRAGYDRLNADPTTAQDDELAALQIALSSGEGGLPRLDQLVVVSQAVKTCDETFSRLLDALDEYTTADEKAVLARKDQGVADIDHLRLTASVVLDDARVVAEVKRTETSWQELETLVEETMQPASKAARDSDAASDTSSVVSMSSQTYRHPLSRPAARIASNPSQHAPRSVPEQRNRAASDTPSRVRLDSIRSGLPRMRKASMGPSNAISPVTSVARPRASTPSSIPRPSRLSNASSVAHTTPTADSSSASRVRKTSRLSVASASQASTPRPRKAYVADPKSKLDVAVGRIVNKLKVNVPIRPVGADTADEWKDQSGKYWIGAEGRAKLCFCRILRSKTVMVRVGGGWVELSKFLQDHFADSFTNWDPSVSGIQANIGSLGIGSATPVPITSASLATSTPLRSRTLQPVGGQTPRNAPGAGLTPGRNTGIPHSASDQDLLTPQRTSSTATPALSPQSASNFSTGGAGPSTPLVPLHFIRKASESPEVRQLEREKLVMGRRSILGRSHSGNVASVSPEKGAEVGASPART